MSIKCAITPQLVLATFNPNFSSYDLATSIGPLSGFIIFNTGHSFGTTLGTFTISAGSILQPDVTSTFTATVGTSSVPEPTSLSLLGLGLAGLASLRRKFSRS